MPLRPPPSLLTQAGLIIGLITLLAVIGIGSSFFVTKTIQGTGTTINASGTLRMLSHKIATQMTRDQQSTAPNPGNIRSLIYLFESRLNHPTLHSAIPKPEEGRSPNSDAAEIYSLYHSITQQWSDEIKPPLERYATLLENHAERSDSDQNYAATLQRYQQTYLSKLDGFVFEIDRMVKHIEERTEGQIQLLHDIEYISLLLLLITILAAPFLFHRKILAPLKDLLHIAKQVRQRDFSTQAQYHRPDELGQLAQSFNLMISDLSATYTELEERIADKTEALIEESNRLTLMEERNAIAQELHDSLAQSIFYLNIQITRINTLFKQQATYEQLAPIIDELKQTSTSTESQLRELISTFRIQINPEGLAVAVKEIIQREQARTNTQLLFHNQIPDFSFSHNEEVHLIQIIQEAISNISKHAHANHGEITLSYCADENLINLSICDDGVGIPADPHRPNHFGLSNMEERAHAIHGKITITLNQDHGTRVTLQFQPALSQESPL